MAEPSRAPPGWTKFAVSAAGGCSGWLIIHPFDLLKVRMQLQPPGGGGGSTGMLALAGGILKAEGVPGLFSGLSAALTRQCTNTTLRIGLYDTLREAWGEPCPVLAKLGLGLAAGGAAGTVCCPVEVALVRLQADAANRGATKRGYRHVGDALVTLFKEEGVGGGWRGVGPTVVRGMVVGMTQIAVYDQVKGLYSQYCGLREGVPLHLASAVTTGVVSCTASLPIDLCKTRMQNQAARPDGSLQYTTILGTMRSLVAREGVLALWHGYVPYLLRGGGHTVTMFLFLEQYRRLVANYYR